VGDRVSVERSVADCAEQSRECEWRGGPDMKRGEFNR